MLYTARGVSGSKRIASLDGLRAVSILAVTASHMSHRLVTFGGHGVDVFFVISGYLITHLLLLERERSGTISLFKFYLRRAQRIVPAFALFLCVAMTLFFLGVVTLDVHVVPMVATYTYNLFPSLDLRVFGPVWSLCVEEHFYFLWPSAVLLICPRRLVGVLASVFVIAAIIRFWLEISHSSLDPAFFTLTRLDTIAAGCLLAIFLHSSKAEALRGFFRRPWLVPVCFSLFLLSAAVLARSGKYQIFIEQAAEALLIAVVVGAMTEQPSSWLGRFLNSRVMVQIGLLSYSLYLGQFIIVDLHSINMIVRCVLLAGYALFSYYVVESPVLRMRRTATAISRQKAHT